VKDEILCHIQNLTQDAVLKTLAGVIKQGWSESKLYLPPDVQDYCSFKKELTLQKGVIFQQRSKESHTPVIWEYRHARDTRG